MKAKPAVSVFVFCITVVWRAHDLSLICDLCTMNLRNIVNFKENVSFVCISEHPGENECTTGTHNCSQGCTNLAFGYQCSCSSGYELMADLKNCRGEYFKTMYLVIVVTTVYTRILAKRNTQNKNDEIVGSPYTRIKAIYKKVVIKTTILTLI